MANEGSGVGPKGAFRVATASEPDLDTTVGDGPKFELGEIAVDIGLAPGAVEGRGIMPFLRTASTLILLGTPFGCTGDGCGSHDARSQSDQHATDKDEDGDHPRVERVETGEPRVVPLEGVDPARAPVQAMMEKAHSAIPRVSPGARLSAVSAKDVSPGGTVDITKPDAFQMVYLADDVDPSKPPGKDVQSYAFTVDARASCSAAKSPCLTIERHVVPPRDAQKRASTRPHPLPTCGYAAMWKAVVDSGVPSSVVANVTFDASDDPPRWSILVPGHSDLSRQADGTTCQVPKTGVCNCRPADPLCDCR